MSLAQQDKLAEEYSLDRSDSGAAGVGNELHSPLGLVAGNGLLPVMFVESARAQGLEVAVIGYRGETDPRIEQLARHFRWIRIGQLGTLIKFFKQAQVQEVVFAGGIRRPRLLSGLRLDLAAIGLVARLGSVKDDVLLRGVSAEIERAGMRVVGADSLLQDFVPKSGLLTRRDLSAEETRQAIIGWEAARQVGKLDIGQTVVVKGGLIVAVEAIDGTDATILRAGTLTLEAQGGIRVDPPANHCGHAAGAVVVKLCKPQQDTRLDLPTIGCTTIETMAKAGASAMVIEAGKTIVLDPAAVVRQANHYGIAVRVAAAVNDLL